MAGCGSGGAQRGWRCLNRGWPGVEVTTA
jgi:hypothetical protein